MRQLGSTPAYQEVCFAGSERYAKLNSANDKLGDHQYRLKFRPDELTYIFVEKTEDVMRVIQQIKEIQRFQRPRNTAELIISRIIPGNQIERDF